MTTGELQRELQKLTGKPCRTWNRTYLERTVTALTQAGATGSAVEQIPSSAGLPSVPRFRDRRLPAPGNELIKRYKDHEIHVRVLDNGFECFGQRFETLTAIAKVITRQSFISGPLFFGIAKRKRAR